eukprot:CAMPEP_0197173042 /NCGR_PEP_ID=MMETSP1423-20130617/101_1 /TAXON_ID=476441 /ORGANISM="Pseudo-nitzschia heimii, Strain UNC1101" /LENGTH=232 /DNA_ID=CAMNT_0042621787 /DNA_START=98 /DNA_END=793 /DNA_ORIENTATION=+
MNQSIFIPIDLEASLGRIEDSNERKRKANEEHPSSSSPNENTPIENLESPPSKCSRSGITRTSSRTPFLSATDDRRRHRGNTSLLKPYPISETDDEIRERKRLRDSIDWSGGFVANSPPNSPPSTSDTNSVLRPENSDVQSMMEVTVDDFVLSAEEAVSLTDLDSGTIQDEDFWETPVRVATSLSMDTSNVEMLSTIPFSVTFCSQDSSLDEIDDENELADAAPIRSIDMEW